MVLVSKSFFKLWLNCGISYMLTANPREHKSVTMACAPCPPPRMATTFFMKNLLTDLLLLCRPLQLLPYPLMLGDILPTDHLVFVLLTISLPFMKIDKL